MMFIVMSLPFTGVHSPRALDLSPPGGGANRPSPVSPPNATNPVSATGISHHPDNHQGTVSPPAFQPPVSSAAAATPLFFSLRLTHTKYTYFNTLDVLLAVVVVVHLVALGYYSTNRQM